MKDLYLDLGNKSERPFSEAEAEGIFDTFYYY